MEAVEPLFSTAQPSYDDARSLLPGTRRDVALFNGPTAVPHGVVSNDAILSSLSPSAGVLDGRDLLSLRPTPGMTRAASNSGKSLAPWPRPRPCEERSISIGKGDRHVEKWDTGNSTALAGRGGRQFAVANVGNNGRIYLRPLVRSAHQKYPQPNFSFPVTPPGTSGVEVANHNELPAPPKIAQRHDTQTAPTPRTLTAAGGDPAPLPGLSSLPRNMRRHRALSDGTIHDPHSTKEPDTDEYRLVVSNSGPDDVERPKTTSTSPAAASAAAAAATTINIATPLLNIQIPSWRLGTPRFTVRGTPEIRGSSYAPTEDLRYSGQSSLSDWARMNLNGTKADQGLTLPQGFFIRRSQTRSLRLLRPMRSTNLSTHLVIEPAMFNKLTFKPTCDDWAIVRYSANGTVTAATAPRLVAEITSPSFLDYELISDFFLTFRSFLEPEVLLRMLIARLRWALERVDETGMIVRVRTFVAIRHWILNYFIDDFILDYGLRMTFCTLLNTFVDELDQDARVGKVQLKILGELKKCWRRICAHYWDGPNFDDCLGVEVPIVPGGILGNRDSNLDPSFFGGEDIETQLEDSLPPLDAADAPSLDSDTANTAGLGDLLSSSYQSGARLDQQPNMAASGNVRGLPLSRESREDAFLYPNMRTRQPAPNSTRTGLTTTRPKTPGGKRMRPAPTHLRNNSITDSLREHNLDGKSPSSNVEFVTTLQSAGRLVRGSLLPPGQPFVHVEPKFYTSEPSRQTTVVRPRPLSFVKEGILAGAASGYGVKKLIGSVRRALSGRGPWLSPSQPNGAGLCPVSNQGIVTDGGSGGAAAAAAAAAIADHRNLPRRNGARQILRIDLLGAEVVEDFKKAVREEQAAVEAERLGIPIPPKSAPAIAGPQEYSAAHMDSTLFDYWPAYQKPRPASDIGVAAGSELIIIVDGTHSMDTQRGYAHGGVPSFSPSDAALADSFMPAGGDPTPPTTPPAHGRGGTPRRSSCLLDPHMHEASPDIFPLLVPDLATLDAARASRPSEEASRDSFLASRPRRHDPPPVSKGLLRMIRRKEPRRSRRSMGSGDPRHASFSSQLSQELSSQESDMATTDSVLTDFCIAPEPEPRYILRRRPGGDLRAATEVQEGAKAAKWKTWQSEESLTSTTLSESIRSSYLLGTRPVTNGHIEVSAAGQDGNPTETRGNSDFSVGRLAEKAVRDQASLTNARLSKVKARPPFEEEVRKLAHISDDDDDDGGVEAALLKLEGRYQSKRKRPSRGSQESVAAATGAVCAPEDETLMEAELSAIFAGSEPLVDAETPHLKPHERALWLLEGGGSRRQTSVSETVSETKADVLDEGEGHPYESYSFLSEASHESYCSVPLLERGLLTDEACSKRVTTAWTDRSVLRFSDDDGSDGEDGKAKGRNGMLKTERLTCDLAGKASSGVEIKAAARLGAERQSFLDDASIAGSDLSSELPVNGKECAGAGLFTLPLRDTPTPSGVPPHPFGKALTLSRSTSPSASMTMAQALDMTPERQLCPERDLCPEQIWASKPLPLTPETPAERPVASPWFHVNELGRGSSSSSSYGPPFAPDTADADAPFAGKRARARNPVEVDRYRKYSVHLPFILAFDSEILAQQFTVIEKDALNDIDWKDLIEMNWKDCARNHSRSWVEFLKKTEAYGVEVVIARFNIMVKWAISEIILTQQIEERARCIVKMIHIAAHCRRHRNFATLAQLTMALTSPEMSRLSKTWELVPEHDMKTLGELETLVTPTRNFYNLRAEMETGCDGGCIPFVGIYTHDLLYNAQRPSEVASSPTTAPLINFERYRIGAGVVKTLLRLLEASTRYDFRPIEGIIERCLWIGALSDDEIRRRSESLE